MNMALFGNDLSKPLVMNFNQKWTRTRFDDSHAMGVFKNKVDKGSLGNKVTWTPTDGSVGQNQTPVDTYDSNRIVEVPVGVIGPRKYYVLFPDFPEEIPNELKRGDFNPFVHNILYKLFAYKDMISIVQQKEPDIMSEFEDIVYGSPLNDRRKELINEALDISERSANIARQRTKSNK